MNKPRDSIEIGERFICIKDVEITGRQKVFTEGLIYASEHKNCLTNDWGCIYTIVWSSIFNFNKHFKQTT